MSTRNSAYLLKKGILLLALSSVGVACNLLRPVADTVTLAGCYQVTFLSSSQNTDQTTTWRYLIEEQCCAQDLSYWMLELPTCVSVLDASPFPWEAVQPDPNLQLNGIKWLTDTEFERGEFSLVLSGQHARGATRVGVKGPEVAIAEITGPACEGLPAPLTATVTPTGTATPTITPLPTGTIIFYTLTPTPRTRTPVERTPSPPPSPPAASTPTTPPQTAQSSRTP